MEIRYFVEASDGTRYGPADVATLRKWADDGRLNRDSNLIVESSGERLRAGSVPGIFPEAIAGPPPVASPGAHPATPPFGAPGYAAWSQPVPKKSHTGLIVGIVVGAMALCVIPVCAGILFPVFAQAKLAAKRTTGLSNVKQVGTALLIYGTDWDDHFPLHTESALAMQPALSAYAKSSLLFQSVNPNGGEILGDPRLAGRNMMNIPKPYEAITLFDSLPWQGGKNPVGYADGHAKTLPYNEIASEMAPDPFDGLTREQERALERR